MKKHSVKKQEKFDRRRANAKARWKDIMSREVATADLVTISINRDDEVVKLER